MTTLPDVSEFAGDFNDYADTSGWLLSFNIRYNYIPETGHFRAVCTSRASAAFRTQVKEAISSCGMIFTSSSEAGSFVRFFADIPAPKELSEESGARGDDRVQNILERFLQYLQISGFPPGFTLKIQREFQLLVASANRQGEEWMS